MPRFENPIVLATRPQDASDRFLTALHDTSGPFQGLICPAFENVSTAQAIPDFDIAIFTSSAGVSFAPAGAGRRAFCVGQATAQSATHAGYTAISADGDAADLIAVILTANPTGKLLHIRGETSVGDVTTHLRNSGLTCDDVIVYRKDPRMPTAGISAQIAQMPNTLIPLFSAETVSILTLWPVDFSTMQVIAISPNVASAAAALTPAHIHLSDEPNMASMVAATARLIA